MRSIKPIMRSMSTVALPSSPESDLMARLFANVPTYFVEELVGILPSLVVFARENGDLWFSLPHLYDALNSSEGGDLKRFTQTGLQTVNEGVVKGHLEANQMFVKPTVGTTRTGESKKGLILIGKCN